MTNIRSYSAFPACLHGPLTGRERQKQWIKEGSKLSCKVLDILDSKQMRKDIPMLSTGPQTAAIEGFHSVVNHFAPKMTGFSYQGILHRTILAALHFNENANRKQATDRTGKERYNLVFRKSKDFTVQEVKVDCTFAYVERLMQQVTQLASDYSIQEIEGYMKEQQKEDPIPRPLCASHTKPNKDVAVTEMKSRFRKLQ